MDHVAPLVEDENELEFEEVEAFYDWWHDFVLDCGSLIKALKQITVFRVNERKEN